MKLSQFEGAIVDLDGTVYLGDELIPGADDGIAALRDAGVSVLFLSNKPVERRADYSDKLTGFGIPTAVDDVVNSASITASYLSKHRPDDAIFVVGENPLRDELREAELSLTTDPDEATVLLASMDREFDYQTLTRSLRAMDGDTTFLATNPDRTCPTEAGEIPDAGAIVGAIEGATGAELDAVLGKPSRTTVDAATDRLGADPADCLMIGDRLETDILMGERTGMTTVLVRSGVTDAETLARSDVQPDYVIDSLADIRSIADS